MTRNHAQGLQLQKIEKNPGILPVKLGQAYKQEDRWVIVKILDLNSIENDLNFNIIKYKNFSKLVDINKPFQYEFKNIQDQVEFLMTDAIEKFEQLVPNSRPRRGLLNPLGSIIKLITGNLDHDDALRYDKLISKLQNERNHAEHKISIISTMLDSLVNSTETLHENSLILDERLKRIERIIKNIATKENNSIYSTYILGMYNMFMVNFRTIYLTLSEVETALAFSKVSVLHQSIVNTTELMLILDTISKTNSLVYQVNKNNLVQIERTMVVKAYVKGNQITYIIEIPLIDNVTYSLYKLYPLPILIKNRTTVIIPKYPYLLAKSPKFLPLSSACEEIYANQYLCTEEQIIPYPEQTCVEQLIRFQTNLTLCTPQVVNIEDIKLQRIGPVSWILYSRNDVVLTKRCSDDTSKELLRGTFILTTDESCEFHIGGAKLNNFRFREDLRYKIVPVVTLPELKSTNPVNMSTVNLKGVNLDDIRHLAYVLKNQVISENLESENESVVSVNSVSLATIVLYVILAVILISFIIFKFRIVIFRKWRNDQGSQDSPDNFALNEGGVMPRPRPRVIQVRA